MPRYFFHVHDGKDVPDQEGSELPDDKAAKDEAVVVTGEMLKDLDGDFWNGSNWHLEVVNEIGMRVCQIHVLADSPE